jgi:hypothetical protein
VALPLAAGVLYACHILLTPAIGAALMSVSTVIVAVNAGLLRLKEEPKSGFIAESQTESKDEFESDTKAEPLTEAKNVKPEAKDEATPEAKDEPQSEANDISQTKVKAEAKPEANTKTKPEVKAEHDPETEVKATTLSDLTPHIVEKVHELYEELGRETIRAVMELEKTEQEIPKPETKDELQTETKSEPKEKTEPKPELKAGHQHVAIAKPKSGAKK